MDIETLMALIYPISFLGIWMMTLSIAYVYSYIIYSFDPYEKEPVGLLFWAFISGASASAALAFLLNTEAFNQLRLYTGDASLAKMVVGTFTAPMFEELLKGLVVAFVYLLFRKSFDGVVDGIVYAFVVALAFAATENAYYLHKALNQSGFMTFATVFRMRVIEGAALHGAFTSLFGIGLAKARLSRGWALRILYPITGMVAAISVHSVHNYLALNSQWNAWVIFAFDSMAVTFIVAVLLWAQGAERIWIQEELLEELNAGLISQQQYHIATSIWDRNTHHILYEDYRQHRRLYQLLTDLAFTKRQSKKTGENHQNEILQLRAQIRQLNSKL